MTDVLSKQKRSQVMAAVRSKGNRVTELRLVSIFRAHGITGWRRHDPIPGKPDFVFRRERLAVFVDGCFWHGCKVHGECPASNRAYWLRKLARNKARDRKIIRVLREKNWRVLRVWEHSLHNPEAVIARVQAVLLSTQQSNARGTPTTVSCLKIHSKQDIRKLHEASKDSR
jgi:DNA mismatch endonuclease (patch repair protein)